MDKIIIEPTKKTPKIIIDSDKYYIEIIGNSLPENVRDFYLPLIEKIKAVVDLWKKKFPDKVIFLIKLNYFNSSSTKFLFDMINTVITLKDTNIPINIDWYFEDGDDDLKEAGEELSEMLDYPFNYILIKSEN
ncbi:MAG TPA: DUF1987 domain-containing protein [Bacteroidales bacterium]|nr:DUF1987 domain-containing protein [Bacteroidales bacterium]